MLFKRYGAKSNEIQLGLHYGDKPSKLNPFLTQKSDNYIIVGTLAQRDAIPAAQRTFGMRVVVIMDPIPANNGKYILANLNLGGTDNNILNNTNFIPDGGGGFIPSGTALQYIKGDGTYGNFASTVAAISWSPDGNTFGAERYIGTNDNFDFPVRTNGVEVARFTAGGNVTIGSLVMPHPAIKFNVTGNQWITGGHYFNNIDTTIYSDTSAYFGPADPNKLVVFNSRGSIIYATNGNTNLGSHEFQTVPSGQGIYLLRMQIQENGNVGIGTPRNAATDKLHVRGTTNYGGVPVFRVENLAVTAHATINDDGNMYISSSQYTGIQWQVNSAMVTQIITTGADIAKQRLPTDYTFTRKNDDFIIGGKSGVNWFFQAAAATTIAPTAKVHIQAEGNTSAEYGLKVLSLAGTSLLQVRADGFINTGIPTSNTGIAPGGTVSGDLWHDLLTNIVMRVP